MKYILVGAGPEELIPPLETLAPDEADIKWVGVDRGTLWLYKNGISPYKAFGDFDSLNPGEREWLNNQHRDLYVYPAEKDETDMEIAVNWAIEKKPAQIILAGASGRRLDHFVMNTQLMLKGVQAGTQIYLHDKYNKVTILKPGEYSVRDEGYKYVSLLPVAEQIKGLTLTGFRYPLYNKTVKSGSSLCVSNEITAAEATISFDEGYIYLFQSKDKEY